MTQTQLQKAHEERLDVGEGLTIFVRSWRPETSARGVVVIVPGFNSHSGYYGWVAEQLVAGGSRASTPWTCGAADSRTANASTSRSLPTTSTSVGRRDARKIPRTGIADIPARPQRRRVSSRASTRSITRRELTGFICESFAHEIPAPDFALAVFKGLSHVAPHAHILHLKNEIFSRDPKAVQAMDSRSADRPRNTADARRWPRWSALTNG